MESYFLKSSLSLIILYALYRIMLRYEFDHQLNRFIGLACVLFSISFPFIQLGDLSGSIEMPVTFYVVSKETADFHEAISTVISNEASGSILILYAIGAGFFLLRSVIGMVNLLTLYMKSSKSERWGFKVVSLDREMSPFVFFNVLFIGNNRMEDSEHQAMLLHEEAHRVQCHSIDALILELLSIVFWFNPAMWFFMRDIKAEHEYFSDKKVLEAGVDPLYYQLVLFKARTGASIELGNYLSNKTGLIKRFNMITSAKSKSKGGAVRASVFLALMVAIVFLSAFSDRNWRMQVDKIATYEQGEEAMYKSLTRRIDYPSSARNANRSGVVYVSFTVDEYGIVQNVSAETGNTGSLLNEIVVVGNSNSSLEAKGIDDALKAASVSAVGGLGKFIPAQKDGKAVTSVLTLPVQFRLILK